MSEARHQAVTEIIPRPAKDKEPITLKELDINRILHLADVYRDARAGWANETRAALEKYLQEIL